MRSLTADSPIFSSRSIIHHLLTVASDPRIYTPISHINHRLHHPSNYIDALLEAHDDERSRLNDGTLSGSPPEIRTLNSFVSQADPPHQFQANHWTSQLNPSTFQDDAYAMTVPGTFENTSFAAHGAKV